MQKKDKAKKIENIVRKFQREMQKLVDNNNGITSISMEAGGEKITIAEKKEKTQKDKHES